METRKINGIKVNRGDLIEFRVSPENEEFVYKQFDGFKVGGPIKDKLVLHATESIAFCEKLSHLRKVGIKQFGPISFRKYKELSKQQTYREDTIND